MEKITEITLAWDLFGQGVPKARIAQHLGRNRETIILWLQGIEEQGLAAFLGHHQTAKKQPRPTRQVRLSTKQLVSAIREREHDFCGQKIAYFLEKELAVRDVRVWLELAARNGGHGLENWQDGEEAAIDLERERAPFAVRPDAWFVLRLEQAVFVGLVEVDRGTERGDRRWQEKLGAYRALLTGGRLPAVTGYVNARVLVIAPNARRRDRLAGAIAEARSDVAPKFWIAERTFLTRRICSFPSGVSSPISRLGR